LKKSIILEVKMKKNLIREKRQALGISQVRLGNFAGLPCCSISDFERGVREPWPRARRALARALQCAEDELFPKE
jgi:transcriptional regulator with XRE-family HTH domain